MDYTGLKCPVCGKPFTSDDDIVVCPECGAPYHRACYQQAGHCIFQEKHGTPDAWKPPEKQTETGAEGKICPRCGKKNARESVLRPMWSTVKRWDKQRRLTKWRVFSVRDTEPQCFSLSESWRAQFAALSKPRRAKRSLQRSLSVRLRPYGRRWAGRTPWRRRHSGRHGEICTNQSPILYSGLCQPEALPSEPVQFFRVSLLWRLDALP